MTSRVAWPKPTAASRVSSRPVRILAIAPQPFFTPRGTPLSVYYRTLVTAGLGHDVDLLTYGQGHDVELEGVQVIRIPPFEWLGPIPVGPSLLKLFLDGVLILRALGLLLRRRYDVVHAHEESVFFSRWLKPLFRFKLIYDMHSSLPQQLTNFRFTTSRALIGLFEALENSSLSSADAVITISPALARYATSLMPEPQNHFLIENSLFDDIRLTNSPDIDSEVDHWLGQLPIERRIVSYAGTLEPYQGIDLLLGAFVTVGQQVSTAHLLVVGGSSEQVERYRRLADELGIGDRCLFTGALPIGVTRALSRRAAVVTSPRVSGDNTPLKIYEQLASNRPLVATRILAHTQVLSDDVCYLAEAEPGDFARALIAALTDESTSRKKSQAAHELYDRKYSRTQYVEKMRAVLAAVE